MGTYFVYPFSGSTSPNYLVTSDFLYSTVYSILSGYTVMSVFGRIGNVSGQTGDYDISQITGLVSAINAKQNIIATGSTSQYIKGDGSLGIFPTSNSGFTNDAQYITSVTGYSNPSWITSFNYSKLTGTPTIYYFSGSTTQYTRGDGSYVTIPTNVSSFINDAGYITVAGSGTITGITLNTPNVIYTNPIIFTISGGSATGTLSLLSQSSNTIFAAPITGGTPSFRLLVASDIPDTSANYFYAKTNVSNLFITGQTIQYSGGTQLTLGYDSTHNATLTVDSAGQITIAPTSAQFITLNGKVQAGNGFQTTGTGTSSNLSIPQGGTTATTTVAQLLPTTATTVNYRRLMRGATSSTPAAGTDYIGTIFGQEDATMASSGIHTMFANTLFYAPTITTNTGSTLLEAANVYIKNAPTGGVANFALHVGGASQFDAPINITNTNAQLFLNYDATHVINFTVLSNGNLTISGNSATSLSLTSFSTVSTTNFTVTGTIATNSTAVNSNFYVSGGNSITGGGLSQSTASLLFAGASTVSFRVLMRGSSASTLGAGDSYSALLIGQHAITTASSGTHGLLTSLVVRAGTVTTNTGSTITNTSSFYIDGAGTVGVNNYAMWIGSGISKFDGGIQKPINATAKTTTYNITTADHTIRADSTASGYTITLPTAVGIQGQIFVVRVSAGTNTVTLATTSSQNINGTSSATTYTGLTTKGKYVWVQSNNVDWDIISSN